MKILFESRWKRFVNESNILRRNSQIIDLAFFNNNDDEDSYIQEQNTEESLEKIPYFKREKIKKIIGSGIYGTAFELESGNVLKISKPSDVIPGQHERESFEGKNNKNTLHVYENGEIEEGPLKGYVFYEMPKYEIFSNYISKLPFQKKEVIKIGKEFGKTLEKFTNFIFDIFFRKNKKISFEILVKYFLDKKIEKSDKTILKNLSKFIPKNELIGIFRSSYTQIITNRHNINDFHLGNLGRDSSGNWVFFDY